MNYLKIALSILAMAFGVFMIIYGEADDSPGGQFLGLVLAVIGIWGVTKSWKKLFR